MPLPCSNDNGKITGQHLFLGATVLSFNVNMGWGGNPASLTVELIDDKQPIKCYDPLPYTEASEPLPVYKELKFPDNHYLTCTGDSCYVDEYGRPFNIQNEPKPKERKVPGKVYYATNAAGEFISRYWYLEDPGFFATGTSIQYDGSHDPEKITSYDIIGIAVVFKMDNFIFSGIVKSWEKNDRLDGVTYTVNIESTDTILNNTYMILSNFGGAIFGQDPATIGIEGFGFPANYYGDKLEYSGQISKGNLPNIFNVFGFLESFDSSGFGTSQKNDDGIPAYMISDAISILTSSLSESNISDAGMRLKESKKRAFSPFGRILVKTMQEENTAQIIVPSFGNFGCGVLQPVLDKYQIPRTYFTLDLSELPVPPRDYRISAQFITISDFIRQITSDTGRDFFCVGIPAKYNNQPLNIIKIRVIDRTTQPPIGSIAKTVQDFKNANIPIINSHLGIESNNNSPRVLYIGGEQQRLYQAKNYRLGYSQTNYIYNPATHQFVNFDRFQKTGPIDISDPLSMWKKQAGKIKIPAALSTRNPWLSTEINGEDITKLFNAQENLKLVTNKSKPEDVDTYWTDSEIGGKDTTTVGNYLKTQQVSRTELSGGRFLPLYEDVICPFFGYQLEETVAINTGGESNNFRKIRPVYLDRWTGNINVSMHIDEAPLTSLGKMRSIRQIYLELTGQIPYTPPGFAPPPTFTNPFINYPINSFTITETEMRCQSFDSYFEYCMLKSGPTKPDLFVMLLYTYMRANKPIFYRVARDVNRVQNPAQANGALPAQGGIGAAGQPIPPQPGNMNNNNSLEWISLLDKDFIKDLERLHSFIQNIARYYGKKYMVRIPELAIYKDTKYADLELPAQNGNIYIFNGSGKLFYNYEPCDSGWEEPGNIIDDSLVIGSAPSYILMNDNGTYSTILGYNATDSFDHVRQSLCKMQINNAAAYITGKSIVDLAGGSGGSDPPANGNLAWRKSVIRYDLYQQWKHMSLGTCDDRNFIFPSLDLSQLDKNDYTILDTLTGREDAYGNYRSGINDSSFNPPLAISKKLYITTRGGSSTDNIAFLEPKTLSNPRVVIDAPGIPLNSSSLIYETDPTATVISNVAIEDLMVYSQLYPIIQLNAKNNTISDSYINTLLSYVSPIIGNATLFINNTSNNQSTKHRLLTSKMAHPFFAAIPVKYNQIPYGPWTNYPAINAIGIFPMNPPDKIKSMAKIENLITSTLVDIDPDLVPWNYGGMSFLDRYVLYKMQNNTDFQHLLESAQINIPGLPIFGIGGEFIYKVIDPKQLIGKIIFNTDIYTFETVDMKYKQEIINPQTFNPVPIPGIPVYIPPQAPSITIVDDNYQIPKLKSEFTSTLAPIVSNISLSVDANGISTNYSFRTYSRKLGLYNKETSDRFKSSAINNIRRNKQIIQIRNSIVNSTNTQRQAVLEDRGGVLDMFSRFGNSPNELLVGSAFKYVDCPILRTTYQNMNNINPGYLQDTDLSRLSSIPISESIRYGRDRGDNTDNWDSVTGIMSKSRHSTWVGNFQSKEAFGELMNQYNRKSAMSMDGIFSPISFYPTLYDSTYPMASYPRESCPACNGLGYITDAKSNNYIDDNIYKSQTFHNYACPLCSRRNLLIDSTKDTKSSQQSIEKLPPYIITSGTDISLLSSFLNSSTSSTNSVQNSTTINLYSLQPIVVPYGLFNNVNAQNDKPILTNVPGGIDRCRHSIQVVARGEFPQISTNFYTNKNLLTYFNPAGVGTYGDQAIANGNGINADYYLYDIEKNVAEGTMDKFLLNQRFFGMRGPLMMHGWGYDTEGYPVPNAADEPIEYDTDGRPKRFILDSNGLNDYTKEGAFDPIANQLGDIIGKGYKKDGGKWVKTKSKYFYLNWAERPDLWPVGPIDLRWDENRRVWTTATSASIYKMVYITLEEDLVKEDGFDETYPARGFLDDIEYSTQALPNNARRLVYIKDRAGFTAPRGAKLLCRYDADTGFYEPITKPQYIVFGVISSGNTATIELAYVQGLKRGENIPTILTTFDNSKFKLKIQNGKNGMFLYSNGKWILTSVEP